jgi:hypothetical protein
MDEEEDHSTTRIGGDQARRLRVPGQDIAERPGTVERSRPDSNHSADTEGVLQPPAIVDNTPTADGRTPRQTRRATERSASDAIRNQSLESGEDGRSPDPRRTADEAGTGSSAIVPPEETDPRRTRTQPSASTEAYPSRARPPHYFTEQKHQVYYHDVIVYIEGVDVSPYLLGSVQVSYGFGRDWNKCDLTIDNAGHRFTLTPENIRGQFRTPSPRGSEGRSVSVD